MKKLIVLFVLLLFVSFAYAYDLNACVDDNSFAAIGNCIAQGAFGGDLMFFAIIMLMIFTIFMWQARAPMGAALGLGLILFFAMSSFFGDLYTTLLNLMILAIGVLVGLAILHFIRR